MSGKKIKFIPIDKIHVLNPRVRNQKIFQEIVANIEKVGLKRPITVTSCKSGAAGKDYDLVCGQGRMEAFIALGQTEIPAVVIEASQTEAYMMSLTENLARRKHKPAELMEGVEILRKQGYDPVAIATKTGLTQAYVTGVVNLLEKGEERLVAAVESGHMPISIAIRIADTTEDEQLALQEIYETSELRGKKFLKLKAVLDTRRRRGKSREEQRLRKKSAPRKVSAKSIILTYKKEIERKQVLVDDARRVAQSLMFSKRALYDLLQDREFERLLRAEKMPSLPDPMKEFIASKGGKRD